MNYCTYLLAGSCSSSLMNGTSVWTGNMVSNLQLPVSSAITNYSLLLTTNIPLTSIVVRREQFHNRVMVSMSIL